VANNLIQSKYKKFTFRIYCSTLNTEELNASFLNIY